MTINFNTATLDELCEWAANLDPYPVQRCDDGDCSWITISTWGGTPVYELCATCGCSRDTNVTKQVGQSLRDK